MIIKRLCHIQRPHHMNNFLKPPIMELYCKNQGPVQKFSKRFLLVGNPISKTSAKKSQKENSSCQLELNLPLGCEKVYKKCQHVCCLWLSDHNTQNSTLPTFIQYNTSIQISGISMSPLDGTWCNVNPMRTSTR